MGEKEREIVVPGGEKNESEQYGNLNKKNESCYHGSCASDLCAADSGDL
jgi:hypothetical protein